MKMHKLKKHILEYKEFIVNSKNRTLSLQVVSNGVPLGQLDHFEFNSPYHSRTFQTISTNHSIFIFCIMMLNMWPYNTYSILLYFTKQMSSGNWYAHYKMWRYTLLAIINRVPLILKFPIVHSTQRPALKFINHQSCTKGWMYN